MSKSASFILNNLHLKTLFFYFILFITTVPSQYQDFHFNHITTDNGLSKSSVTCVLQDKTGYMWFGTFNGLNRYDGYEFSIYQYDQNDPKSISHNYISSITEDSKNRLWVGTIDGLNCYDRTFDNFKIYRHNDSNENTVSDNQIEVIYEDSKNRLWIGTRSGGLNLYNDNKDSFTHFMNEKDNSESLSSNFVREIFEDSKGNLWIGHWNGAIDIYNEQGNKFAHLPGNGNRISNSPITSIVESKDKNIWIGTQGDGLFRTEYRNGKINIIRHFISGKSKSITGNIILTLTIDKSGNLWIGTEDEGLNIYDLSSDKFYYYKNNSFDPSSLNHNSIYSICEDNIGNIWLGTYAGGVNLLPRGKTYFQYFKHLPWDNNSLGNNSINDFLEDDDRNIWIATNGAGLDLFSRETEKFTHFNSKTSGIDADIILSLSEDENNNLWIGTWAKGLYQFNRKTKKINRFTKENSGLASNNIFQIEKGTKGELWLCTFWGGLTKLNYLNKTTEIYSTENSDLSNNNLRSIYRDHFGKYWIGSDVGLDFFDPETGNFKAYHHIEKDINSISKGFVSCITETSDTTLWIGTTGGLNKFDRKTESFIHYKSNSILPNDEIMCIIEDKNHFLWISTNRGISGFDPATETFKNYDVSDGLQANGFNPHSGTITHDGEIIFGGNSGFNIYQPENLQNNPFIPPVIINEFKIFNKPVKIGGEDSPLKKSISETDDLVLTYKQSVFSFGFVALNYISPEKNQYAYQLVGFDKDWNYVGNTRTATYTNLDPGKYTFKVKASNNDGIWNEKGASLNIVIEPPFWKTWWAYLIETYILIMIFYFILNYYRSRQRLRNTLKMEHLELEKMYELDQMKTHFFSNISHEFYSPMTLILSPIEKLISNASLDEKIRNSLALIYRNAKRLQRMANQLKDLTKLETGDLRLNLSRGDIIYFIKEIHHSFLDYAYEHKIEFDFDTNQEQCIVWFDPDKLDKIIYNILSNAFKFTSEKGRVSISIMIGTNDLNAEVADEKDIPARYIEISISDTGVGIPKDKVEHIFKRFYQVDTFSGQHYEGVGVGLAFVNELVKLYRGDISVESKEGEGTKFTVQIPIDEHFLEENQLVGKFKYSKIESDPYNLEAKQNLVEPEPLKVKRKFSDLPVVLIVEDDNEIRDYIKNTFDANYRIFEAENGMIGYKKAVHIIPDLIITDIKMKELDGIQLCEKIKNDERTSHIPIIMLTSYSSNEYRIKGLTQGADVYLTKPFHIDVLEAHMVNLFDSRKKLREKFSNEIVLGPAKVVVNDIDEKFLSRLTEIIEGHISEEKFNADVLSDELGMSRMQLYRKLRGLTNQTVHEFIRSIRLKRAVQLLEQKKMSITEVAYAVGFNDLTYFARCFRKQFDKSPSEYISNKS